MIEKLRVLANKIPFYKRFKNFIQYPPGHYYSSIPSIREIKRHEGRIFDSMPHELPGISLNAEGQLRLLDQLKQWYPALPFSEHKARGLRYYYENDFFSYADAIMLFCMMRQLRPKRIIEVGSGFSSAVMMDTNQLFFENAISCTFIEPFPDRLRMLLTADDSSRVNIVERQVQDVGGELFSSLTANDILFIDSSHVSKIDSDVNHMLFRILPALASGVYIHVHDIIYPFEYQKRWVYEGMAWNEAYLLRAFLQYNTAFEIMMFNSYLAQVHRDRLESTMPLCLKNTGGSIWLRKV